MSLINSIELDKQKERGNDRYDKSTVLPLDKSYLECDLPEGRRHP